MTSQDLEDPKVTSDKQHQKKHHDINPKLQRTNGPKIPYDPRIKRRFNCSDTSFRDSYVPRIIHPQSQQVMRIEHWSTNIHSSPSSRKLEMMDVSKPWEALRTNFTRFKKTIGDCEVLPVCPEEVEYDISAHGDEKPNDNPKSIVNSDMEQIEIGNNLIPHKNLITHDTHSESSLLKRELHHQHNFLCQGNEGEMKKPKSRQKYINKRSQSIVYVYKDLKYGHYRKKRLRSSEDCREASGNTTLLDYLGIKNDSALRKHSRFGEFLHQICGSKTTTSNFVFLVPTIVICFGIFWLYQELGSEEPSCTVWTQCPYEATKYAWSLLASHFEELMHECYAFLTFTDCCRGMQMDHTYIMVMTKIIGLPMISHNFGNYDLRPSVQFSTTFI